MRFAKTIIGFGLFIALACLAQVPYHNSLVWRANQWKSASAPPGAPNAPTNISSMGFWWVASDLPDGVVSGGWTDRIHGLVLKVDDASKRPLKRSNYVAFSSNYLTNALPGTYNPWVMGWITSKPGIYGSSPNWESFIVNTFADPSSTVWRFQDATFFDYLLLGWDLASYSLADGRVWCGLIIYTNNHSLSLCVNGSAPGRVDPNGNIDLPAGAFMLGAQQTGNNPLLADLFEFWIWTNKTIGATESSNLNWYATNTYAAGIWAGSRTNLSAFRAQYVAADYTTNAGVPTLADRSENHYDLTNLVADTSWPTTVANGVNTNITISFNGITNYLRCAIFTNTAQAEYFMVAKLSSHGTAAYDIMIDGNNNAIKHQVYRDKTADTLCAYQGSSVCSVKALTNAWAIFDFVFTGSATGSGIATNNVFGATGNAGATANSGLLLGAQCTAAANIISSPTKIEIAELLVYRGYLSSDTRLKIYNELKGIYGL